MKFLKIGITGSAGSGKSLVCHRFKQMGFITLDCDIIARQVVEPGMPAFKKIIALFGKNIVSEDGTLDRAKMRHMIVNDNLQRRKLENILHPQIIKEMVFQMENAGLAGKNAVAVEVPLLFELGMQEKFDITIAVTAKARQLVKRICSRDNVSGDDARKILDIQLGQKDKIQKADYIIINRGTKSELFESVDNLFNKIKKEFLTT